MRARSLLLGGAGAIAAILLWWLLTAAWPVSPSASVELRLGLALAALLPALFLLWLMILAQMLARFRGAVFDPLAGAETNFLRVNQRVISNTVEQLAIFIPALLALALRVRAGWLPAALALAIVFAAGRLAFWIGYLRAPISRAPGMAATIVATSAALFAASAVWLLSR